MIGDGKEGGGGTEFFKKKKKHAEDHHRLAILPFRVRHGLAPTTKNTAPPTPRPGQLTHATFSSPLPAPIPSLHPERQQCFQIGFRVGGS